MQHFVDYRAGTEKPPDIHSIFLLFLLLLLFLTTCLGTWRRHEGCFSLWPVLVSQGEGSNVPMFRGYSQHLETKASFSPASQLATPAAPQSCLLEEGAALSTFPATCSFPLPRASNSTHTAHGEPRQKTSPATCFGKAVLISPEHIGFQWDQVPEGKAAFFCSISDLNQHKFSEVFFLYALEMVKLPLFHRALLRTRKRWQHKGTSWSITALRDSSMDGQAIHYSGLLKARGLQPTQRAFKHKSDPQNHVINPKVTINEHFKSTYFWLILFAFRYHNISIFSSFFSAITLSLPTIIFF